MSSNLAKAAAALLLALLCAVTFWLAALEMEEQFKYAVAFIVSVLGVALATALASHRQTIVHMFLLPLVAFISFFFWLNFLPHDPLVWEGFAILLPFDAILSTAMVLIAGFLAYVVRRILPMQNESVRRIVWLGATVCVFTAPTLAMLNPMLSRRQAREDMALAGSRFRALKAAVELTKARKGETHLCDSGAIKANYRGLPFDQDDLARVTLGAIFQDRYAFFVYCGEQGGSAFTISAGPAHPHNGVGRQLCSDESGATGCDVRWTGSRYACFPCKE